MGPRGVWQRAMDWRWLLLLAAGLVVWVSHISAWAVLIVMVAGADFSQRLGEGWRRWWRPALTSLPMFAPVIVMVLIPGTSSDNSYGRFWWLYKKSTWNARCATPTGCSTMCRSGRWAARSCWPCC
jgi:hypothetical protein